MASIIKTRAIVLGHIKYNDSSIIVRTYTSEFGPVSFIVKGVNSKRAKFRSALFQAMTPLTIEMDFNQKRSLQYIREASMLFTPMHIHTDVFRSSIALFLSEIIGLAAKEEEANEPCFDFLIESIQQLDNINTDLLHFNVSFLISYTKFLGFYPKNNYSEQNIYFDLREGYFESKHPLHVEVIMPPISGILSKLLTENAHYQKISSLNRTELTDNLLTYYALHLPGFGQLKSLQVLREVYR